MHEPSHYKSQTALQLKAECAMYKQVFKMRISRVRIKLCLYFQMLLVYGFELGELCNGHMSLNLPLSWFLWSPYVLCDAPSKLPHYVPNLLSRYLSVWFHSPYAKYVLPLAACEKSCFEVCYTGRDEQRNTILSVTREELEVQSLESMKTGKSSALFLLSACAFWAAQPRQEFESKFIEITNLLAVELSK